MHQTFCSVTTENNNKNCLFFFWQKVHLSQGRFCTNVIWKPKKSVEYSSWLYIPSHWFHKHITNFNFVNFTSFFYRMNGHGNKFIKQICQSLHLKSYIYDLGIECSIKENQIIAAFQNHVGNILGVSWKQNWYFSCFSIRIFWV